MTRRRPITPASVPWRRSARALILSLATAISVTVFAATSKGLLLPQERHKTLTALADAEPVVDAQHPHAQGLQWFLI